MSITYTNELSVEDYNMLREAVGWQANNPIRVKTALDRSDFIVSAKENGKSIGMARVIQDGLQSLVMDVVVSPEYQGRGVGKAMMQQVMEYLREVSRSEEGGIFVNLMSAKGKDGFYEQFGFVSRPNELRGPGMRQLLNATPSEAE